MFEDTFNITLQISNDKYIILIEQPKKENVPFLVESGINFNSPM